LAVPKSVMKTMVGLWPAGMEAESGGC